MSFMLLEKWFVKQLLLKISNKLATHTIVLADLVMWFLYSCLKIRYIVYYMEGKKIVHKVKLLSFLLLYGIFPFPCSIIIWRKKGKTDQGPPAGEWRSSAVAEQNYWPELVQFHCMMAASMIPWIWLMLLTVPELRVSCTVLYGTVQYMTVGYCYTYCTDSLKSIG